MKQPRRQCLSRAQVQEIIRRYPDEPTRVLAQDFNTSVQKIYKTAQRYGITKSAEFMLGPHSGRIVKGERKSRATEFKKGHKPWSSGKKLKYKPSNLWEKGHKPFNTAQDGEVRWRHNPGYYFIRISENNWEFYHRWLWKEAHGKIKKGYNVIFKDGNPENCILENLECISNAELAVRNSIHRYPENIKNSMRLLGRLKKQIKNETDKH